MSTADVWSFDPVANRWDVMSPLPAPRRASVAVLGGAVIVVTGGYDGASHHMTTCVGT